MQHERDAEEQREGEAGEEVELEAAGCGELNSAEGSEADLAENPKVLKVPFLPLLGLLGRITASSPRVICTDDACPSAPILSARALNILRVGIGGGAAALGISFTDSDESCLVPGVRLLKPPVPGHCCCCCPPHCDHGSPAGAAGAAAAIHGNCG